MYLLPEPWPKPDFNFDRDFDEGFDEPLDEEGEGGVFAIFRHKTLGLKLMNYGGNTMNQTQFRVIYRTRSRRSEPKYLVLPLNEPISGVNTNGNGGQKLLTKIVSLIKCKSTKLTIYDVKLVMNLILLLPGQVVLCPHLKFQI